MKAPRFALTRRAGLLAAILLTLVLAWALLNRQIRGPFAIRMFLGSPSPREEAFTQLAKQADDPVEFLKRCWASGKVPHRELVASFLNANATANPPWFDRAEPLVLAGVVDGDASVRELALAVLEARRSPRLVECAEAQLTDVDPIIRLLGVQYLRKADPQSGVPVMISLLDDPDLRVVTEAEVALMNWTGEDYGVRVRLALDSKPGEQPGTVSTANAETIRRGVERRKQWWQLHAREYPAKVSSNPAHRIAAEPEQLPSAEFALKDLRGRTVRLSDFRGKLVLLNFWATWCPACLDEIPDLIALQKKLGDKIAIVGVALDGVPDEEGEQEQGESGKMGKSLNAIHAKVERAVKSRGINYSILLDPHSSAGGQFNGGELPTTVILDTAGRLRRRFIGARSLKVFEAMLAEAQKQLD